MKNKYEVSVSVNATVTIAVEASSEEEAKSIVEDMEYTEFENKEYEVHSICDIDEVGDIKRFDECAVCGEKLFIEDNCYEDSISGGSLCDGHAVYLEAEDVYVPDFDILIEKAVEAYDQSEDFWHGTTHYDVNFFKKDGELWASVYQVKDEQTDVYKVVYSKKLIAGDSLYLSVTDEIVHTETSVCRQSIEVSHFMFKKISSAFADAGQPQLIVDKYNNGRGFVYLKLTQLKFIAEHFPTKELKTDVNSVLFFKIKPTK